MSYRECEHPNCKGSETPAKVETDMGWLCQGHYDCALEITRAERRLMVVEEKLKACQKARIDDQCEAQRDAREAASEQYWRGVQCEDYGSY